MESDHAQQSKRLRLTASTHGPTPDSPHISPQPASLSPDRLQNLIARVGLNLTPTPLPPTHTHLEFGNAHSPICIRDLNTPPNPASLSVMTSSPRRGSAPARNSSACALFSGMQSASARSKAVTSWQTRRPPAAVWTSSSAGSAGANSSAVGVETNLAASSAATGTSGDALAPSAETNPLSIPTSTVLLQNPAAPAPTPNASHIPHHTQGIIVDSDTESEEGSPIKLPEQERDILMNKDFPIKKELFKRITSAKLPLIVFLGKFRQRESNADWLRLLEIFQKLETKSKNEALSPRDDAFIKNFCKKGENYQFSERELLFLCICNLFAKPEISGCELFSQATGRKTKSASNMLRVSMHFPS